MKKVRVYSLLILLLMASMAVMDAQHLAKKNGSTGSDYAEKEHTEDTVKIIPKSKSEIADSLYVKYNAFLSQGTACDSAAMYNALSECYSGYFDVLGDTSEIAGLNNVKERLRSLHLKLYEGGVYFSMNKNVAKSAELLEKYVMMPKSSFFKDEVFSFPSNYSDLVYFVAADKYNAKDFKTAITLFNDYLNMNNNEKYEQTVFFYLSKCYGYTGHDNYRIYTLMNGVQKYPKDVRLYKEIIEHHIKTRNAIQAEYYMITYETLGVNRYEILDIKARIAELKEDFHSCMLLSEQLYNIDENNINGITLYGRSCYNYVVDEMKNGKRDVRGNPMPELIPYLENAAQMFELAVKREPNEKQYYDALIDTYSLLKKKDDALAVAENLKVLIGNGALTGAANSNGAVQKTGEAKTDMKNIHNDSDEVPMLTSYGVPVFSYFARGYVKERLALWLEKGTFEKTADYNERINGVERINKERELINEAKKEYIDMYKGNIASQVRDIKLAGYDADNETFLIKYLMGDMLIRVPVSDKQAENFKSDWYANNVKVTEPQYDVVSDTLMLTGLTFYSNNSGLSYEYSVSNQLSYVNVDVKIDPVILTGINVGKISAQGGLIIDGGGGGNVLVGKVSDVDVNVPEIPDSLVNENAYALIISNENYDNSDKVPHAINDGTSFKNYCVNVLGIPAKNIEFVADASYATMVKKIEHFSNVLSVVGPEARGVVYYSGHGVPNLETGEAFFLPKDGVMGSFEFSIPINSLYSTLGSTGAKRIDVYLDCCFGGVSRSGHSLYAARGTLIKPRESAPKGNMMVFTACSGKQYAKPHDEQPHGLFTYFLLKKLKETSGNITMGELFEYVKKEVYLKADEMKHEQTPTMSVSTEMSTSWQTMDVR
ncbi:MAG: caspase family protein [Muribaculaceae bacterium]|nr:caspase family protein [Muribaculaceae bacterium]